MNSSEYRKTVFLNVNMEDDAWCVTSPTLPGLFAGGDSLEEARTNARQVVDEEIGSNVDIVEWLPVPEGLRSIVGRSNNTINDLPVEYLTLGSWPEEPVPRLSHDKADTEAAASSQ